MQYTFAHLVGQSQKAIETIMGEQDYNPISVIQGEVATIIKELSADDLRKLIIERPSILDLKPPRDYYTAQCPSGADIIRACVQMEIEANIDLSPFSDTVKTWIAQVFRPPEHLLSKMKTIAQAA
ncbi:hypothetical protein [Rhizobium sp. MHM7A]|uniref:hypothetical protein n=1 Tax=Rhizobium sp. MHM7A TaxID=2583233 RepID=UPI0011074AD4|nr:hypothetical protein [Rhizobium sp. MHM7A]TLX15920.1 hypothetical protein FFR93_00980 [Rhizobium sp. MHM7A]